MTLTRILTEGYGPGAWHGADIKAATTGVSSTTAFKRPRRKGGKAHNIAEITLHHAFYVHSIRGRLLGTEIEPFLLKGEDWFPLADGKKLSWKKITTELAALQAKLARTVADIEAGKVSSPLSDEDRLNLVLGISCHSAYHAGQIQLIKLLL
ncbi:MAG: hypothetical protein EPO35_03825 [Acidobacteria bacterium]|nr:MAG: hypothetical protein EPO35_03825 [Acidobacteriota bacterium]